MSCWSHTWMLVPVLIHLFLPRSGQQGGYKIVTNGTTIPLHLQPDSIVAKRAPFTASTLWVTPFKEEQVCPFRWKPATVSELVCNVYSDLPRWSICAPDVRFKRAQSDLSRIYLTLSLHSRRDTPKDSILSWMEGDKNLDKTDIVLYLTYGATHIPRPEDFPSGH